MGKDWRLRYAADGVHGGALLSFQYAQPSKPVVRVGILLLVLIALCFVVASNCLASADYWPVSALPGNAFTVLREMRVHCILFWRSRCLGMS